MFGVFSRMNNKYYQLTYVLRIFQLKHFYGATDFSIDTALERCKIIFAQDAEITKRSPDYMTYDYRYV